MIFFTTNHKNGFIFTFIKEKYNLKKLTMTKETILNKSSLTFLEKYLNILGREQNTLDNAVDKPKNK